MEQIVVFSAAGIGRIGEGWYNRHMYRVNRLYRIRSGTGYYTVSGETRRFEKGHIYFLPWTVPYSLSQESADPMDHVFIDFMSSFPGLCSGILDVTEARDEITRNLADFLLHMTETLSMEVAPGFSLVTGSAPELFGEYKSMMQTVLGSFLARLEALYGERIPKEHEDIYRAVLYIHTHYSESLDVESLAEQSCLNKRYFIAKFKKVVGETPYRYLQLVRYDAAMGLHAMGVPLSRAAEQAGFSAPSSLYRLRDRN